MPLSIRHILMCVGLGLGLSLTGIAYSGQAEGHYREAHHRAERAARPAHPHRLLLRSAAAIVQDAETGEVLYDKNADAVTPIASITKLMTAMVVLDAGVDLNQDVTISSADKDWLLGTRSRLRPGATLSRKELLRLALMSSENRAAAALARTTYPGGIEPFLQAMNHKARMLGMNDTHFDDATGLSSANVSSAEDLVKMVRAAHRYALIRKFTTTSGHEVQVAGRSLAYHNTDRLVSNESWNIGLSKTGFTNDAGHCLVLQATLAERQVIIVLLDSWGRLSRIGDANRIRAWLEANARSHSASAPRAAQESGDREPG
ncbi:MAG TPA: D-alanyl-D-alanine endopeptidase [Burkholderiales bacterium]|nr:D-alanyl-D-alanine endopeptidase [Burkholderiales bacterium]